MKKKKKCYQKPQIKAVDLAPEEAVLSGCKTTMTGVGKARCTEGTGACENRLAGS